MIRWLRRLKYRILTFREYGQKLNAIATVEQEMLDCYHGKRKHPDKKKLFEWARKLGVPEEYQ